MSNMPESLSGSLDANVSLRLVTIIGVILSFLSGMVNTLAFLEFGFTVAHHTGNTNHMGRHLVMGEDALVFGGIVLLYFCGSMFASLFETDGDAVFVGRNSSGFLCVAGLIASGALVEQITEGQVVPCMLWACSQGLQNGITSRFSKFAVRTTHMTGNLTDAGLTVGHWLLAKQKGLTPPPVKSHWSQMVSLIAAFAAGGMCAGIAQNEFGIGAAMIPALLTGVLAVGTPVATMRKSAFFRNHVVPAENANLAAELGDHFLQAIAAPTIAGPPAARDVRLQSQHVMQEPLKEEGQV